MIVTTTPTIEGRPVAAYLGIVSGESVLGTNIFRDFLANISDIVGGRSGAYETSLRKGKDTALQEMIEEARALGADALVGVTLGHEVIGGDRRTLLLVTATGTAVRLA